MITRSLITTVFIVMVVLFIGVPIAYADDCSSSSDCSNVVQGTGCLSALLGLFIGTAAAATKPKLGKSKLFDLPFDAAKAALKEMLPKSTKSEYGTFIYRDKDGKYFYTTPQTLNDPLHAAVTKDSSIGEPIAYVHTHTPSGTEEFSKDDINLVKKWGTDAYLGTPEGRFLKYSFKPADPTSTPVTVLGGPGTLTSD